MQRKFRLDKRKSNHKLVSNLKKVCLKIAYEKVLIGPIFKKRFNKVSKVEDLMTT